MCFQTGPKSSSINYIYKKYKPRAITPARLARETTPVRLPMLVAIFVELGVALAVAEALDAAQVELMAEPLLMRVSWSLTAPSLPWMKEKVRCVELMTRSLLKP